jgi:ferredoxin-NADP reductase
LLFDPPCASSTLAAATTIHLAVAALRSHRGAGHGSITSLTLISLLLAAAPWLFPSPAGVAFGLAGHAGWFAACELLAPWSAASPAPAPHASEPQAGDVASARVPHSPPAQGFVEVPIVTTIDEADGLKTIRLQRPDDFAFLAGQFVAVRVRVDGKEHVRCYSISSAPDASGYFEVTIQRRGMVSNALHVAARPGAMLSIKRPNGRFVYPANDDRPILLLAGGVGVTPLMSMLRHGVLTEPTRPITLVYSAQVASGFAFRDELASIVLRHPQARVILTATRDPDPPPHVRGGRVDAALLRSVCPDVVHSLAFVCGPKAMIDDMRALLAALGVPPGQVRHELFEAAIASSAASPGAIAAAAADASPALPARHAPVEYPMRCTRSGTTVAVRRGETLLDAAERSRIDVPSLCRAGVCGTCRTRVMEGTVECTSTTLDARERASGFVLACVATARTACTVDL